MDNTAHYRFCF